MIPGVVKLCDFGKWMCKFLLLFYCFIVAGGLCLLLI